MQRLYDYVESMGDQLQLESIEKGFSIIQSMPRKEYTDKEKTLAEAGLYPRAILIVKEND